MTDDELADLIRRLEHDERYIADGTFYAEDGLTTPDDVRALLTEVTRLRTREVALAAVAQAVADPLGTMAVSGLGKCCFCGTKTPQRHSDDCPVTLTRALLASDQPSQ